MNKLFIFALLCLLPVGVLNIRAQVPTEVDPGLSHELKIDLLNSIVGQRPTVAYEYIVTPDFGLGADASLNLGFVDWQYYDRFRAVVFSRWYFGGLSKSLLRDGAGFFIGANTIVSYLDDKYDKSSQSCCVVSPAAKGASWGLGAELGWKYLSLHNWVGETGFRLYRYLLVPEGETVKLNASIFITVGLRF